MKLATYRDGSRDGQLVVVSRDLTLAHFAAGMASRLQQVLDDWNFLSPQLEELSQALNHGKTRHAFPFEPSLCMAPLPRAYQRVDAWAYAGHLARVHSAQGAMGVTGWTSSEPAMCQGSSDDLAGPRDDIVCAEPGRFVDFEAGLAVITGDVRMGSSTEVATDAVRMLMLANGVALRRPAEASTECLPGLPCRPATAFSPVAVTPDELLGAWHDGRVRLDLDVARNGTRFGHPNAGAAMTFHFGELIAHLCRTRGVRAGSIVCSGPVSDEDESRGQACIAEKRVREVLEGGAAATEYLQSGDTVRLDMKGLDGHSVFGTIEQTVVPAEPR